MNKLISLLLIVGLLVSCNSGKTKKTNVSDDDLALIDAELIDNTLNMDRMLVAADFEISKNKVGFAVIGDSIIHKIPSNISYEIKTITRSEEGVDYEIKTLSLYNNGAVMMRIELSEDDKVIEISVLSALPVTNAEIGVGSSLQDFIVAYPDYKLWYTYVSDRFILETNKLKGVQFLIDIKDYSGDKNKLKAATDIIVLKPNDFNSDAVISSIRVFYSE